MKANLSSNQVLDGDTLYILFYRKDIYLKPANTSNSTNQQLDSNICEADIAEPHSPQVDSDLLQVEAHLLQAEPHSLQEIIEETRELISDENISKFNIFREEIFQCF